MTKFYFYGHQKKEIELVRALIDAGWQKLTTPNQADVIFTDVDIEQHAKNLNIYHIRGKKIFIYPHAAMANLFGDFDGYSFVKRASAQFVTAPGHVDVMRAWGYTLPLEVIGWYLCPTLPFKPRAEVRRVLFAPIHPNSDNTLSHIEREINAGAYKKLLALLDSGQIELTLRYIRGLENNGLWNYPGVKYVAGKADQSTVEIDEADIVVSHQTMLYLAVARGIPTVGMGEDAVPMMGSTGKGNFGEVKSWNLYSHLMQYPLDILTCDDTMNLFRQASESDADIADWRERMVGLPFDPARFVMAVEKY